MFGREAMMRLRACQKHVRQRGVREPVKGGNVDEEASENMRAESSEASTQRESWARLEAYVVRQEAFLGRLDEFMRAQAKLMERYEEALNIGR